MRQFRKASKYKNEKKTLNLITRWALMTSNLAFQKRKTRGDQ